MAVQDRSATRPSAEPGRIERQDDRALMTICSLQTFEIYHTSPPGPIVMLFDYLLAQHHISPVLILRWSRIGCLEMTASQSGWVVVALQILVAARPAQHCSA